MKLHMICLCYRFSYHLEVEDTCHEISMGKLLRNTKKEAASKSSAKPVNKNDCKNCKKSFKSLKQHLRQNLDCQHVYGQAFEEMVPESGGKIGDTALKKECRYCKKAFVSLLQHIKKAKKCKENYGSEGKCRTNLENHFQN